MEAVSGMAYEQFVRENQIDYLGLKQTFFTSELDKVKREDISRLVAVTRHSRSIKELYQSVGTVYGYVDKDGQLVASAVQAPHALKGFSDIWASAENISHWDIGLAGGVLIAKPENRAMIYKPTTLDNGNVVPAMAGWQFYAYKGIDGYQRQFAGTFGLPEQIYRYVGTGLRDAAC